MGVSRVDVRARRFREEALGEVLDVVVFVLTLSFVDAAAVVVVSKKLGPEMKGSISSVSSTSFALSRGCNWRGWACKYCPPSYEYADGPPVINFVLYISVMSRGCKPWSFEVV
jgi:hypothetical protein